MKLKGRHILNHEMVTEIWSDPDFDFQELWNSIQHGTLLQFENEVSRHLDYPLKKQLNDTIRYCLACLQESGKAPVPEFLKNGALDKALLIAALDPYKNNSYGTDKLYFADRNAKALNELAAVLSEKCGVIQAWTLYLFLLLQLQYLPKAQIREKDKQFIIQRMEETVETESLPSRMALCGNLLLRCTGSRIEGIRLGQDKMWFCFYQGSDPIGGLTYTHELGLIAFTNDGQLCDCTPTRIRSAVAEKRIVMAAACVSHYILLADDGSVVSSLPLDTYSGWSDISRVHMGLNSACGISGNQRSAILYGAQLPDDFSDVTFFDARFNDEQLRFAVLTGNGTLHFDQGPDITDVTHVCLVSRGYIYIRNSCVYLRSYGSEADQLVTKLPTNLEIAELHVDGNMGLCGTAEKPYLFRIP